MSRPGYSSYSSDRKQSNVPFNSSDSSLFTVRLDDVTAMTRILNEIQYSHNTDDQSVLLIDQDGMRLIIAYAQVYQVSAFFARSIFQSFTFDANHPVNFRFDFNDFITTLTLPLDDLAAEGEKLVPEFGVLNDKISLWMQYRKRGEPIRMKLQSKSNCLVECELKPFNLPSNTIFSPLSFHDSEDFAMIHMDSKYLHYYITGFDYTGDLIHFRMGRGDFPLRIGTNITAVGDMEIEISKNDEFLIHKVRSDNTLYNFRYKTQLVRPALEALKRSHSVRMKIGASGLLCIEHFHEETNLSSSESSSSNQLSDGYGVSSGNGYSSNHNNINNYSLVQAQDKISSVEYFIRSETKIDCVDSI